MSPSDRKEGAEQQRGDAMPSAVWEPWVCGSQRCQWVKSCQSPAQVWVRSWQGTGRGSLQGSSLQPAQELATGTGLSRDLRLPEDGRVPTVSGTAQMFEVLYYPKTSMLLSDL